MKKLLSLITLPIVVTTVGACNDGNKETIKLGMLPIESNQETGEATKEFEQIAKHIGIGLNSNVEIVPVESYSAAADLVASGDVDLILGGTAAFWEAEETNNELDIFTTFAPYGNIDESGYKSVIGTHIDNKVDWENLTETQIVAKLKGKSFSFNSKSSTSGGLIPQSFFWQNTTDADYSVKSEIFTNDVYLGNVELTGSHDATIKNILDKTTDFGAYYDAHLKITTDAINTDKYVYEDMFQIIEIQAPASPLWGNLDSGKASKMNEYLKGLNYDNAKELYENEEINFSHSSIQFVAASKELKAYQDIKSIDQDATRS